MFRFAAKAVVLALCAGCVGCDSQNGPSGDFGHLAVTTSFSLRDGDIYMYGDAVLAANADHRVDTILREPVGTGDIMLKRREFSPMKICSVTIKKDNIVTVALTGDPNGNIVCKIER